MARVIAVDLGAESGRIATVEFNGHRFALNEVHRFSNTSVHVRGTLHWDVLNLWHEITSGIHVAREGASGIGVATWGVDFALLDRHDTLIANPVSYRDSRTDGMMEWVFDRVPRREIFERTGIQFLILNTLYQLASVAVRTPAQLERAHTLLMLPDLLNFWLTGEKVCEFSDATTTQFYNPRLGDWDRDLLSRLSLPTHILAPIIQPGTKIGSYEGISVFAPACHDTGSAVVAVPATTPNFAYISSGTWSLIGLELDQAVISDESYAANVTNEGGAGGTFRFLKNVMGLWLAQQCRSAWRAEGTTYTYDELTAAASQADAFRSFIDPDEIRFLPPGDMPQRIRAYCHETEQPMPETVGQVMRVVYESLALKYRYVLDKMIAISEQSVDRLHIVGGGTQNKLLCQMTADAVGCPVVAGPVEGTVLGNAIVQLIALGELASIADARAVLAQTIDGVDYQPHQSAAWERAYQRFKNLLDGAG